MLLITGSNGQLGKTLKDFYREDESFFEDRNSLDISNFDSLEKYFKEHKLSGVINCAAYNKVDQAEKEKELCFNTNVVGVRNLSLLSSKLSIPLLHISTDYVFNGETNTPYIEEDTPHPLNYYGLTKLLGEKEFMKHAGKGALIRTSWLYSEHGHNFPKAILNNAKTKASLDVVSNRKGCPTYTKDLALAIKRIMAAPPDKKCIYHFSNKGVASWYELAYEVKKLKSLSCMINPIEYEHYDKIKSTSRPKYSALNSNKIETHYQLNIRHWKEALKECMKNLYS